MTFAKGDRVKVEFEATVRWLNEGGFNLLGIADEGDEEYWVPESYLTKIEKVYPSGTVWVWRRNDGEIDAVKVAGAYTKTGFASYGAGLASPDQIIAIHEPE
jgi:hypothetical protein